MPSTIHPVIPMTTMNDSTEYRLIALHYCNRVAERSQIPLMNHINEGLAILETLNASDDAKRAFCLHPLVQSDVDLQASLTVLPSYVISLKAMMLAMEYRRAANAYLCTPVTDAWSVEEATAKIGLLVPDVRHMLIADKVQNRKDFMAAHYGTHPRSDELFKYFNNWHTILGVELPEQV